MPTAPMRLCRSCKRPSRALVRGRCPSCAAREDRSRAVHEPWRAWYHTPRWRALRRIQLDAHPLCQCEECREGAGRVTAAAVVDHVVPHRGSAALFWEETNLQSLSAPCHDRKTAREVGSRQRALLGGGRGI